MRAVRYTDDGLAVLDLPEPEGPDLVTVRSSGVCSSDLAMRSWGPRPVTLGHEFAGHDAQGRAVAVLPNLPCGRCDQCVAGRVELCRELKPTILGFFADGGMADLVAAEPVRLAPLPDAVDVRDACLVEPIAVALHALHAVEVPRDAPVLVVGGGAIGLACAVVGRRLGWDVHLLARHEFQQEAAERLGIGSASGGGEHELVVEAAGSQTALDTAIESVRPGGTVAIPAMYADGVTLGVDFSMKEVRLVPSFTYGHHSGRREFDEAVDVVADEPELAPTLITHRFPLDDAVRRSVSRATGRPVRSRSSSSPDGRTRPSVLRRRAPPSRPRSRPRSRAARSATRRSSARSGPG